MRHNMLQLLESGWRLQTRLTMIRRSIQQGHQLCFVCSITHAWCLPTEGVANSRETTSLFPVVEQGAAHLPADENINDRMSL